MDKSELKQTPYFITFRDILIIQDLYELKWLIDKVEELKPKRILEIGMERGGTLKIWETIAGPDSLLIGIDVVFNHLSPNCNFGKNVNLILGSSHEKEIMDKVKALLGGELLDFLFIDGDHTKEGVTLDYADYSRLVRQGGIIAFHDIRDGGIKEFWKNLGGAKEEMVITIGTGIIRKK